MPQFTSALSLTEATAQIRSLEDDKKFVVTEPQPDGSVTFEVTQDISGGGSVEVAGTLRAVAGGVAVSTVLKKGDAGFSRWLRLLTPRNLPSIVVFTGLGITLIVQGIAFDIGVLGPIGLFIGFVLLIEVADAVFFGGMGRRSEAEVLMEAVQQVLQGSG